MRSWDTKKKTAAKKYAGFEGKWLDLDTVGACLWCGAERWLFRPVSRLDLYLCSPCTQQGRLAALPNVVDAEEEAA